MLRAPAAAAPPLHRAQSHVAAPVYCTPQVDMSDGDTMGRGRISVAVGQKPVCSLVMPGRKGPVSVEEVVLEIPFPKCVKTTTLSANGGSVLYDEATKVAKWTIGKIAVGKTATLSGTMVIQGASQDLPPMQLSWKVPMASVSGIQISSLQLMNERYRPYKGVRTITKSGSFQIRA